MLICARTLLHLKTPNSKLRTNTNYELRTPNYELRTCICPRITLICSLEYH